MNRAQAITLASLPLPEDQRWSISPPTAMGCVAVTAVRYGHPTQPCPVWIGPDGRAWTTLLYPGRLHHLRGFVAMWLDLHYQGMLTESDVCGRVTAAVEDLEGAAMNTHA